MSWPWLFVNHARQAPPATSLWPLGLFSRGLCACSQPYTQSSVLVVGPRQLSVKTQWIDGPITHTATAHTSAERHDLSPRTWVAAAGSLLHMPSLILRVLYCPAVSYTCNCQSRRRGIILLHQIYLFSLRVFLFGIIHEIKIGGQEFGLRNFLVFA